MNTPTLRLRALTLAMLLVLPIRPAKLNPVFRSPHGFHRGLQRLVHYGHRSQRFIANAHQHHRQHGEQLPNASSRIQTAWTFRAVWRPRPVVAPRILRQAFVNGTSALSTARMKGRVLTTPITTWQPTTWTAFTQNSTRGVGVNGATLRLFRILVTAANRKASRTLDLELQLDLTGQAPINAGVLDGHRQRARSRYDAASIAVPDGAPLRGP